MRKGMKICLGRSLGNRSGSPDLRTALVCDGEGDIVGILGGVKRKEDQ